MNAFKLFGLSALVAFGAFGVSGCYTPPEYGGNLPRFNEEKSVNLVVRFYKWDNFFIVQPAYREDGFLRAVTPGGLDAAFNTLQVPRDTAVVLMGFNYDAATTTQYMDHWNSVLGGLGFRRVVCLRDDDGKKLNGLPILNDWTQPAQQPRQTAGL
jgi:hypothetical protein